MRFRLLEAAVINADWINKFRTLPSEDDKIRFVRDNILVKDGPIEKRGLKNIEDSIEQSIYKEGLSVNNKFLYYVLDWADSNQAAQTEQANDKFNYLLQAYLRNNIDINADYLKNVSLFNRPLQEFIYSVNALVKVSDPNELKKYFHTYDENKMSIKAFMNGEDLKPAGIGSSESSRNGKDATIFDVIESWGEDNNAKSERDILDDEKTKKDKNTPDFEKIAKTFKELTDDQKQELIKILQGNK
jgi:hypothetical protein